MEKKKKNKMVRWKRITLGVIVGALLGYGYYYFVGCQTGTCPITSNPWRSMAYGTLMGLVWTIK